MRPLRLLLGLLVAVGVALGLAAPAPAASTPAASTPADSARYLAAVRDRLDLPGLAVRVSGPDGSWTESAGTDSAGADFGPTTPVLIGSVSKSLTATLVLRLVEQGRLGLEDTVSGRLSWFRHPGITVGDLLRHTSGYDQAAGLAVADRFDTAPGALDRAARDAATGAPAGPRGRYAYSDVNYLLLGAIVEETTDRPFADTLRDQVLAPMGLSHTGATADTPRTSGHRLWWGRWRAFEPGHDDSGAPYGYVVSTLDDLDRYAAAHQSGAGLPLTAAHREAMQSRQADTGTDSAGRPMWYGFGWRGGDLTGHRIVEHTGATPGFFSHVLWLPDDGVRVIVVANGYAQAQDAQLAAIGRDLARLAVGERPEPVATADPLTRWGPYAATALALLGAVIAAVAARSRRGPRWVLAATALALAAAAWFAPPLLTGVPARAIRLWAPDLGWSLVAVTVAWTLAGLLALVPSRRGARREPA